MRRWSVLLGGAVPLWWSELVVGTAIQNDHALDFHSVGDGHRHVVDLNVLQAAREGAPDGGLRGLPIGCNRRSGDGHTAGEKSQ